MKTLKTIALALGAVALMTACAPHGHDDDNPTGSWKAAAPESVAQLADSSKTAVKTLSVDFNAPVGDAAGTVTLTADYEVTPVNVADTVTKGYQVVATIQGTWTQDVDDHDDYLLSFDKNSLSVIGTDAPELGPVTDNFLSSLASFTTIEDVEVSKDGTHMTFETKSPDMKYHFVKK